MSNPGRIRIAVDAMSGDGGCRVAVPACLAALEAHPEIELILVGLKAELEDALAGFPASQRSHLRIVPAESVLEMDVAASQALRHGHGSSMQRALELAAGGEAGAVVSAGSTGALMALSRQVMGMVPGIERPALMAGLPSAGKQVWVLDLGANVGVDAHRLCEFARLGHIAVRVLTGVPPRIGLLNIGREPGKGPDVVREAARLISAEHGLDFRGHVEADEVFADRVDLVVCDGFAGNVLLKGAEGMVRLVFSRLRDSAGRGLTGRLIKRRLDRLHDRLDPARHNGAPLLGVRGTVIKSHGSACPIAFANALGLAALEARRNLVAELERQLWASY